MMHPRAYSGAGGLSGKRGFEDGGGGDKEHERVFLPLLTPPGAAVVGPLSMFPCSPVLEAPGGMEREGERECGCLTSQLGGSQHPPSPPRLLALQLPACLPLHLTFARCLEEHDAELPLTPRPRTSGLKIARLLSPGKHTWSRGRGGRADVQAPPSPTVWVGSVGKRGEDDPLKSLPHRRQDLQSCWDRGRGTRLGNLRGDNFTNGPAGPLQLWPLITGKQTRWRRGRGVQHGAQGQTASLVESNTLYSARERVNRRASGRVPDKEL